MAGDGTFANRVNDYISDYKSKIDTMCGLLNIAIEGGPVTFTTASGTKTKNSCGLNGLLNLVKEKQNVTLLPGN